VLISEIRCLPDGIFNGNETSSTWKKRKKREKSGSVSPDHPVGKQTSRSFATLAAILQRADMTLFILVSLQPCYQQTGASYCLARNN